MRRALELLLLVAVTGACGQPADVSVDDGFGSGGADGGGLAWEHLGQVENTLPHQAAAAVLEDAEALDAAWDDHGFDGDPPGGSFEDQAVVLLGQADDACPDQLSRLEIVDGELEVDWLSPFGGCNEPLIYRLHAVRVHRGVLDGGFSYGLRRPYSEDLERVTIELPPYDGDAPPPPEPPRTMTGEALDAVFANHPIVRCGPEHDVLDLGAADDTQPAVEAPVPAVSVEEANDALVAGGFDLEREVVPFVDRSTGGRLAYLVGALDAADIEQVLAEAFGDESPGIRVTPWAPADVHDAQQELAALMGAADQPGAIVSSSGAPGPVRLGVVDPTRQALDDVAELVDPDLVCVEPLLSGLTP